MGLSQPIRTQGSHWHLGLKPPMTSSSPSSSSLSPRVTPTLLPRCSLRGSSVRGSSLCAGQIWSRQKFLSHVQLSRGEKGREMDFLPPPPSWVRIFFKCRFYNNNKPRTVRTLWHWVQMSSHYRRESQVTWLEFFRCERSFNEFKKDTAPSPPRYCWTVELITMLKWW